MSQRCKSAELNGNEKSSHGEIPENLGAQSQTGAGLQEVDRLLARPSIEHQIETENPVLEREGDDGE